MKLSTLMVLAVALGSFSSAAFATSHWSDTDGTLTSFKGATGYYLSNAGSASSLTGVTGAGAYDCGGVNQSTCNGKVSYTTGMTNGFSLSLINTLALNVPVSLGNGTLKITLPGVGTGTNGLVFTGTFSNITWTYIGTCTVTGCTGNEYYQWEVQGSVQGTFYPASGSPYSSSGFNVMLTTQRFKGSDPFASGTGHISGGAGAVTLGAATPESGTLVLFGTGMLALALVVRRKYPVPSKS